MSSRPVSHTPGAVAAGGAIGALLGGLATAGVVASGGLGLLVVGPLLGGAAAGGVTGGFIGAMATRGLEPEIADFYDQALRRGHILVAAERSHGERGEGGGEGPSLEDAERALKAAGADPLELPKG